MKPTSLVRGVFVALLPIALIAAAVLDADAHMGATGVVKQRMEVMKSMATAMKDIGRMVRREAPLDSAAVAAAGHRIAGHGQRIPSLFPKGSGGGVSEAHPHIWSQPDRFAKAAAALAAAARSLAEAGAAADEAAVAAGYRAVGAACSGCHRWARQKKL